MKLSRHVTVQPDSCVMILQLNTITGVCYLTNGASVQKLHLLHCRMYKRNVDASLPGRLSGEDLAAASWGLRFLLSLSGESCSGRSNAPWYRGPGASLACSRCVTAAAALPGAPGAVLCMS